MDQVDQVLSRGDCKLLSHQVALAFVCSRGKRLGLFLECSGVRLCVLFKGFTLDSPGEIPYRFMALVNIACLVNLLFVYINIDKLITSLIVKNYGRNIDLFHYIFIMCTCCTVIKRKETSSRGKMYLRRVAPLSGRPGALLDLGRGQVSRTIPASR